MEDTVITITTFTNPHQFWILYKKNLSDLRNLEKKLAECQNDFKEIQPQERQFVIIYDHGMWKRAIVDKVIEEKEKIHCWLVDYGKSFMTASVYELPKQFKTQLAIAQPASLYKTIPIKHILDVEVIKKIEEKQTVFNQGTLKVVSKYIKKADKITFVVENVINNILCGSLYLHIGTKSVNLTKELVKEKHVILDYDLYVNAMKNNFQNIHKYTIAAIDNSSEIINKFPVSEGIGRGSLRQAGMDSPGPNKSSYVTKWLMQTKLKPDETQSPVRPPSTQSAVRSPSSLSAVSSENHFLSKTNAKDDPYESSNKSNGSESPKRCDRLKPSEINKILRKSPSTDKAEPKADTKIEVKEKVNRLTPSMLRMYQQKSADMDKSNEENMFDVDAIEIKKDNVNQMNRTIKKVDFRTFLKGRGRSIAPLPKVGVETEPKESEEDSWDDSFDSSQCSSLQMNTDESLNKSSFEDSIPSNNIDTALKPPSSPLKLSNKSTSSESEDTGKDTNGPSPMTNHVIRNEVEDMPEVSMRKTLKYGCQCDNCLKWESIDFAAVEKDFKKSKEAPKPVCRPPPLLRETDEPIVIKIEKLEHQKTKIRKDIAPCLLVHGQHLPNYISDVASMTFCPAVQKALNRIGYKTALTVQSYAWPAIARNMSIAVVGAKSSGKTMCYIPAICDFAIQKKSLFRDLPKRNSPLAIILCENTCKAEIVYNMFIDVLKHTRVEVRISLVIPPIDRNLEHVKLSDILVTTPALLIHLLSKRVINLKRLCQLIIEDAERILTSFEKQLDSITNGIQSMLSHRVYYYVVQVVTTSEQWTKPLEIFLKKLKSLPVICIGNYLQCALYARAKIQMHFVTSHVRNVGICEIVKEKSNSLKTIIICVEDGEVCEISKLLQVEGLSVTPVTSLMNVEEALRQEESWEMAPIGKYSVLICSDAMLNTQLSITQAELLIHYSLPKDHWNVFSKRFRCLLDNLESPFDTEFDPQNNHYKTHIFVNEECSKQYPRLCKFLKDIGTPLPKKFVAFSEKIQRNDEEIRIKNENPLCGQLKLLGKCNKSKCNRRHLLSKELDLIDWLPTSGIVKFRLLHFQDGSLFGVKLLERIDTDRKVYKIPDCTQYVTEELSKEIKRDQKYVRNVQVDELHAWYNAEKGTYHRCKVLKILNLFRVTKEASEVLVKLIDDGKEKRVLTGEMFQISKKFKEFPPQSVDVYLANILPPEGDVHWNNRTKNKILNIINEANVPKENSYFIGRILLQLGETLWLDDIQLQEELEYTRETVTILSVKKQMKELGICSQNEGQINNLRKLCADCNIELPNYELIIEKIETKQQVKPQWAHLEDDYNVVNFCSANTPSQFYVRQEKFHKCFENMQKDIQTSLNKPHYPQIKEVLVNNCYLAQDPEGTDYGRIIVKSIDDEMVECFFVDFGDSIKTSKTDLKFLPDDFITRLPFQAIECRLYGVKPVLDCWAYEATDIFYDHCFEPNTDIYKKLYVKSYSSTVSVGVENKLYSVILLDYCDKPVFINSILIECGFATGVDGESLSVLPFPNLAAVNKSDKDDNRFEEIIRPCDLENTVDDSSATSETGDGWDIFVGNSSGFLADLKKIIRGDGIDDGAKSIAASTSTPKRSEDLQPMTALPTVSYSTPKVFWHQTEELIKMDIVLPNVDKYSVVLFRKSMFSFSTVANNIEYKLNFKLFADADSKFTHNGGGPCIRVVLTKVIPSHWDRLTFSKQKMPNIVHDMSKCVLDDEDDEKRLFLTIGKDRPEETDETAIITECGSDRDYSSSDINTDSD